VAVADRRHIEHQARSKGGTVNTITTAVEYAPSFSSQAHWRVTAIVNGKRTSICCMHSHSRQDLAERCAIKYFTQIIAPLPQAELIDIGDGLMEAQWTNNNNTITTRRFRYLPERTN
jgi:hypothetical protein